MLPLVMFLECAKRAQYRLAYSGQCLERKSTINGTSEKHGFSLVAKARK